MSSCPAMCFTQPTRGEHAIIVVLFPAEFGRVLAPCWLRVPVGPTGLCVGVSAVSGV